MTRLVVAEGTRAVVHLDGRPVQVLAPGRHRLPRLVRPWRRSVVRVDVRERLMVVSGQEVAAEDVPGVRVSATLVWHVSDPVAWLGVAADPEEHVRLALQLGVRDWAASAALDRLVADRGAAGEVLLSRVRPVADRVGVTAVSAGVRDVVVPGEVRRAALDLATARLAGQAALERARGETAALRAAANGARVLADNPALLQLRTVEAAAHTGAQVVVRIGTDGPG